MNKVFILLLFIVILSLVINFNVSTFGSNVNEISRLLYNGDEWNSYRLGDVYFLDENDRIYDPNFYENVLYHKTHFPGSIANEYINTNTSGRENKKLMKNIIQSKSKDTSRHNDTLFLHIRVGDVICVKDNDWMNKVNGPLYYSKVGNVTWWNDVLKYIQSNNITKVVIISGVHKKLCLQESANYISDRSAFLKENIPGLKISYRLGQSPDEDILMCYYVKHFISTGGGYGLLIKEIKK